MSSVDKLQIRGIRSFSPNRDETIEFYAPLTMIVGANGCGEFFQTLLRPSDF
jgi:DNA repair protein RAD50